MLALAGVMVLAAAPAEARRGDSKTSSKQKQKKKSSTRGTKKQAAPEKRQGASPKRTKRASRARRADLSLSSRFASIPTPKVPGASKLRLELRPAAGDGKRGKVFRPSKLKATDGATDSSFAQKVRKSTRRALRKQ